MEISSLELMKDPNTLQQRVIEDIEKRFDNKIVLQDPNDVAMHVIEMGVMLTSNFAFASENAIASQNPMLAQTSEDLYKSMSDYDYVNLFSKPSRAILQLNLNKQYLLDNAFDFNESSKKITIPKESKFRIGNFDFGIHYPIDIIINKKTGAPRIEYDLSQSNPLQGMTHNLVSFGEYSHIGVHMIQMDFEAHQFTCTRKTEVLVAGHGFSKKYPYQDKFYAVRLFTEKNGIMYELAQTLAKSVYDPYVVTARLTVEPEVNKFSIHIPQIYFDTNMLGLKLYIELYTTKGNITDDISGIDPSQMSIDFNIEKSNNKYSKVLAKSPVGQPNFIVPRSTKLEGGSDGYGFLDLRRRILNNSLHTKVLVTPADLENYYENSGFRIVRYKDDLTNITYFSYKAMVDSTGSIVPVMTAPIYLTEESPETCSTIKKNLDGTLTILPSTLYRYSSSEDCCYPVTDTELQMLNELEKEAVVIEMNNTLYTKSPFHMRLIPDSKYPKMTSYNLNNPEIKNFLFKKENTTITPQMIAVSGTITHDDEGSNGYKIHLLINKSRDVREIVEDDIIVWVYTESIDGIFIGTQATYVSDLGDNSLYSFTIGTDYYINRNHKLNITTFKDYENDWNHLVNMENTYHVVFMVKNDNFNEGYTEPEFFEGVPPKLQDDNMVLLRQSMTIKLGYALDDVIYNNINLSWTKEEYARYEVDEPMVYPHDIYLTDDNGDPVTEVVTDPDTGEKKLKLTIVNTRGDIVRDELGIIQYKHKAGDIIRDDYGQAIVLKSRVKKYLVQTTQIDAKVWLSENPIHKTYRTTLSQVLETYFEFIRESQAEISEYERVYFRPIRTMGTALFNVGDHIEMTLPINMSFRMKFHVEAQVIDDLGLREAIKNAAIKIIEEEISSKNISLVEIGNKIKNQISYVASVDVLGIDNAIDLQTISIVDDSVQPSVAQELYLTKNNTYDVRKALNVEFVTK